MVVFRQYEVKVESFPVRGFSHAAKTMETETSNQMIMRYLLGDLPEAEQEQIEDRAFSDRAYLRTIEDVENDLIDEYVRGALTDSERRQFERRFLASAERQRKVEFARALAQVVPATEAVALPRSVHKWESWAAFLRGLSPILQFAMVAAVVLLSLGVVWLFTTTKELRTQVVQLQAAQQVQQQQEEALRQQAAAERARSAELTAQLERERMHSEELTRQLARDQGRASSPTAPLVLSLFLPPGIGRGEDKRPKLVIAPTVQTTRLQIGLERGDDFKSYRVELSTAQGQTIWTRERLRPQGRIIPLTIPVRLLRAGQYELALKGVTEAQQIEEVRYYYFDVLKK